MRPRNILIVVAAVVIVALLALSFLDQLIVDYLWYGRLGFGGVFNTTVGAEIAIFLVVGLLYILGLFARSGLRRALDWVLFRLPVVTTIFPVGRNRTTLVPHSENLPPPAAIIRDGA